MTTETLTCAECVHLVRVDDGVSVTDPDGAEVDTVAAVCCYRPPHPRHGRPAITPFTPACAEHDDGALPSLLEALEPFARSWLEALQNGELEALPPENERQGWTMVGTLRPTAQQFYQFWRDADGAEWIAVVGDGQILGTRL